MSHARAGAPISSQTIREAVEGSLRRLQTDYIDLYQFHWPNRGSYMFRKNWTYDPSGQLLLDTQHHMEDALEALQKEVQYVFNTMLFLIGGFLVMWMAAGFAMLEAGMVRTKNVAMQCTKNIALYSLAGLAFWLIGYNLMYPGDGGWIMADVIGKIEELRNVGDAVDAADEIAKLEDKAEKALADVYSKLNAWQKTEVARHPERPHANRYIQALVEDFTPLAGDRGFADDQAVLGGLARFNDRPVVVLGHEKGANTQGRLTHNFGMARPEGYRKAVRLMDLADRFSLPVVALVDTPGAYPGKGAEERGQSEAIARATEKCLSIGVPMVSVIVGEGGSGGAVAFASANRVAMLEHSIYSVISPEGCASILWKDAGKANDAAEALRLTAQNLNEIGVCDRIVQEPMGGAHRDPAATIDAVRTALVGMVGDLVKMPAYEVRAARRQKNLRLGSKGLAA